MSNKKAGFSIVEAVIALTVIVIVSVTAIGIISTSLARKTDAINTAAAQRFADNVLECFKVADDFADFSTKLQFVEGATLTSVTDENEQPIADDTYTYTSEAHGFTVTMTVSFPKTKDERPKLKITVTDSDGAELVALTYTKGA